MGLKDSISGKWDQVKDSPKYVVGRTIARTVEGTTSLLAPVAGVYALAGRGDYAGKIFDGIIGGPKFVYAVLKPLVTNEGFRDLVTNKTLDIMSGLGRMADNLTDNPIETLISGGITYGAYKVAPMASRKLRASLRRERKSGRK